MNNSLRVLIFVIVSIANLTYSRDYEYFYFTKIVNKIPYVIIIEPEILTQIQTDFVNSLLGKHSFYDRSDLYLDTTKVEWIEELYLYYSIFGTHKIKCYEIKSHGYERQKIPGKFVVQIVNSQGSGIQKEITASKFLYHSFKYGAFLIVKCDPIEIHVDSLKWKYDTGYPLPTYSYTFWKEGIPQSPIEKIPEAIKQKADQLAESFFKAQPKIFSSDSDEQNKKHQKFSLVPIRYFHNTEEIYYCALMSYGHKGYTCKLYLFDHSGEIIEVLANKEFVEILGITDVNRDGSHELIMLYSVGDYSGGFEILTLEKNGMAGKVRFSIKSKIATFFD